MPIEQYQTIKLKRGLKSNLPKSGIEGQPYYTMDTGELYIGMGDGTPLTKIAIQTKTLVFVYQDAKEGPFGPSIRFPHNGIIKNVSANCVTIGDADTVIGIDKISESDFKAENDRWETIFTVPITIPASKKISTDDYKLAFNNIKANDYFRLNVTQYGNIKNIVIEVVIETIGV